MTIRLKCAYCPAAFPCKLHHAKGVDTDTHCVVSLASPTTKEYSVASKSSSYQNLTNDPKYDKRKAADHVKKAAKAAVAKVKRG